MMADHCGRVSKEPYYQQEGGLLHFYARDCATVTHLAQYRSSIDIHKDIDNNDIIGFTIWLPSELVSALNARLAEPPKKKISWLRRKWRVAKVHFRYLLDPKRDIFKSLGLKIENGGSNKI